MIAASQPEIWNNSKQSKWDDEELSNRIWGFSDFFSLRRGNAALYPLSSVCVLKEKCVNIVERPCAGNQNS